MIIVPYERVGDIPFGMAATGVHELMGSPSHKQKNFWKEVVYFYDGYGMRVTFSADTNTTVEFGFDRAARDVVLDGIDLFGDPVAFATLVEKDGSPFEACGFIILLRLGITLTGFHDADPSQLAVAAFARGRLDRLLPKLKPWKAPL